MAETGCGGRVGRLVEVATDSSGLIQLSHLEGRSTEASTRLSFGYDLACACELHHADPNSRS